MGADGLRLFNKSLCDELLSADWNELPEIVTREARALFDASDEDLLLQSLITRSDVSESTVGDRLTAALEGGSAEPDIREWLVWDFALGRTQVAVDYWGCYAEVFGRHPQGAISYLSLFPHQQEELFLLLTPEHVDLIVQSLAAHNSELRIMKADDVRRVQSYADYCRNQKGFMTAYMYDF